VAGNFSGQILIMNVRFGLKSETYFLPRWAKDEMLAAAATMFNLPSNLVPAKMMNFSENISRPPSIRI
jgi:hypothetical protein